MVQLSTIQVVIFSSRFSPVRYSFTSCYTTTLHLMPICSNRMVPTIVVCSGTIPSSELFHTVCHLILKIMFSNNTGGWSTEGLTLVTVDELEHRVVCNSSHLTSFAVLVIVSNSTQVVPPWEIVCQALFLSSLQRRKKHCP